MYVFMWFFSFFAHPRSSLKSIYFIRCNLIHIFSFVFYSWWWYIVLVHSHTLVMMFVHELSLFVVRSSCSYPYYHSFDIQTQSVCHTSCPVLFPNLTFFLIFFCAHIFYTFDIWNRIKFTKAYDGRKKMKQKTRNNFVCQQNFQYFFCTMKSIFITSAHFCFCM